MLEHLPSAIGQALGGVRPGLDALMINKDFGDARRLISLGSEAFAAEGAIPAEHTADGAGISPPLAWTGLPAGTAAAVLVVEDADSPTPAPLVHALVLDLPGRDGALARGALRSPAGSGEPHALGKNSFLKTEFLPPDPPSGHGPHRYAFQLFALDTVPALESGAGRGEVAAALKGHVLATGLVIATYERP